MKRGRQIPNFLTYYTYIIESGDMDNIPCRGFIHGGKINYLPSVLRTGGLLCSNQVRDTLRINLARDRVRDRPDGSGVYCRFIPKRQSEHTAAETIASLTGPGSCGGFFFLIRAEDAAGLEFFTMSSGDSKYGLMNSPKARANEWDESKEVEQTVWEWVTPQITVPQITGPQKIGQKKNSLQRGGQQIIGQKKNVRKKFGPPIRVQKTIVIEDLLTKMSTLVTSLCSSKGNNNSEIAFYNRIPLDKIGEVYLLVHSPSILRNWLMNDDLYKRKFKSLYGEDLPALKSRTQKYPRKYMLDLLGDMLKNNGFQYVSDIKVKISGETDTYQRYVRVSQALFPLTSQPSDSSDASQTSLPSGSSNASQISQTSQASRTSQSGNT